MPHWGWYWKIKKQHNPKALCSWVSSMEIDSFKLFKNKEMVKLVKESNDHVCFEIPQYSLIATLQDNGSLRVQFNDGSYIIHVEKKSCNYGGFYQFFHCPACKARMRKLYCIKGIYVCRKCAQLGYYSQRLRPSERNIVRSYNIENFLIQRGGSLEQKPPWMKKNTYQKYRIQYVKYHERYYSELTKELFCRYGHEIESYFPPSRMGDAWVEREE